jgi:hypothetical protein
MLVDDGKHEHEDIFDAVHQVCSVAIMNIESTLEVQLVSNSA